MAEPPVPPHARDERDVIKRDTEQGWLIWPDSLLSQHFMLVNPQFL